MIAIIPARGGSKGLPNKNIRILSGKPLIAYAIEAAEKSQYIERVFLSTDSKKIAAVAKKYGAEVPFMRPKWLAKDNSLLIDVLVYTIERLQRKLNKRIEDFMVLQPTSPLRTSTDINNAVKLFYDKDADSVVSMSETAHPSYWIKGVNTQGKIISYFDVKTELHNRQNFRKEFVPNGAIFIFKYHILKKKRKYYFGKTYSYIMSRERSIDIDTFFDFKIAEYLLKR